MKTFAVDAVMSGALADVLRALSQGSPCSFTAQTCSTFTIAKMAGTYVLRDTAGAIRGSAPSFAEVWRIRPRSETTEITA